MSTPPEAGISDSLPPPAYELSAEDFDRKTAEVLQASQADYGSPYNGGDLRTGRPGVGIAAAPVQGSVPQSTLSQPSSISQPAYGGYNPGAYVQYRWNSAGKGREAAASASAPSVDHSASYPKEKEKEREKDQAAWLPERPFVGHASTQGAALNRSGTMASYVERQATPPPMFEAIGPSLDGPPYEPPEPQLVMTYNGSGDSRPASPLAENPPPTFSSFSQPSYAPQPTQRPQVRQRAALPQPPQGQVYPSRNAVSPSPPHPHLAPQISLPVPRTSSAPRSQPPRASSSPRPMSVYNPPPRVTFDPQVAYARKVSFKPEDDPPAQTFDASAFYNSAVSSHVSHSTPSQKPQTHSPSRLSPSSASFVAPSAPPVRPVSVCSTTSSTSWSSGHLLPSPHTQPMPQQHQQSYGHHQPLPQHPTGYAPGPGQPNAHQRQSWTSSNPYSGQSYNNRPW